MTAKNALRFTGIMTGLFGAVLIARPEWMLDLFDFAASGDIEYWLRRYGVSFLVFTIVFWSAAKFPSSMMQRPILWAAALLSVAMLVLSVIAILDHRVNGRFWFVAGYEAVLSLWFGWLLVSERV